MINNDVLRRVRYALNLNDTTMIEIFALSDYTMTRENLLQFLKKENEEYFIPLNNAKLSLFLNGLIIYKRGKKDTLPPTKIKEEELNNNAILRKLRIALEFKEEDMLHTLQLVDFELSKSELCALFRNPAHKHYRKCGDQVLRNFLQGLVIHFRQSEEE